MNILIPKVSIWCLQSKKFDVWRPILTPGIKYWCLASWVTGTSRPFTVWKSHHQWTSVTFLPSTVQSARVNDSTRRNLKGELMKTQIAQKQVLCVGIIAIPIIHTFYRTWEKKEVLHNLNGNFDVWNKWMKMFHFRPIMILQSFA